MKMVYLSVTFNQEIHFWFCSFVVRYAVVLALKEFFKSIHYIKGIYWWKMFCLTNLKAEMLVRKKDVFGIQTYHRLGF